MNKIENFDSHRPNFKVFSPNLINFGGDLVSQIVDFIKFAGT